VNQEIWTEVDAYFEGRLAPPDAALEEALMASSAAGLPAIQVAPNQGRLLHLLALATGARRILEIGTLGGYSTIWLARALPPGGRLVTLEAERRHAEVARLNLARAGVADRVEVRVGQALELLPRVESDGLGPFDFTFIDADKPSNSEYFRWAVRLSRPGALIVVDNVVRGGKVAHGSDPDAGVQGVRGLVDLLSHDGRVRAAVLQTVGVKGYDGFLLAVVLPQPAPSPIRINPSRRIASRGSFGVATATARVISASPRASDGRISGLPWSAAWPA